MPVLPREREGERKRQSEEEYRIQEDGILENLTGGKNRETDRERATDRNLLQIKDNDKTEAETRKKLAYNKSGRIWNRFISVCLLMSLDGWTTDQGYDHRRLEAWLCLPHSHTTKCSRYNEAALVLITFKENTDTQGNLNTDFCT